jgi:DNA-binding FadR family transcriptional regulator
MTDASRRLAPRRRRHDAIAEQIKDLVVTEGLRPGERLPSERDLMARFAASKGSVREALSALAAQGVVRTRTGPGGGVFLSAIESWRAMAMLGDAFMFDPPTIADIYVLRIALEPELAASLVGHLDEAGFERLRSTMRGYDAAPETAEAEHAQRLAELDFHTVLAELSPNRILGFVCAFLHMMLREMAVCRAIYDTPAPALLATALNHQALLLDALRTGDAAAARRIARTHMIEAGAHMARLEARIAPKFVKTTRSR